jgi:acetyl-CoA decarbonylase/synthase complex subunit delta
MRHPEAIRMAKAYIDLLMDGGSAAEVAPIAKTLEGVMWTWPPWHRTRI